MIFWSRNWSWIGKLYIFTKKQDILRFAFAKVMIESWVVFVMVLLWPSQNFANRCINTKNSHTAPHNRTCGRVRTCAHVRKCSSLPFWRFLQILNILKISNFWKLVQLRHFKKFIHFSNFGKLAIFASFEIFIKISKISAI